MYGCAYARHGNAPPKNHWSASASIVRLASVPGPQVRVYKPIVLSIADTHPAGTLSVWVVHVALLCCRPFSACFSLSSYWIPMYYIHAMKMRAMFDGHVQNRESKGRDMADLGSLIRIAGAVKATGPVPGLSMISN